MEKNLKDKQAKKNKVKKNRFKYFFFNFVKATGCIPVLLFLRPKKYYESKKAKKKLRGGALICGNHTSEVDPIAMHCIYWYRNLHIVALKELFETKLANWFFTNILCIPIDRQNMSMNTFKDIVSILKEKRVVGIFPEGHINNNTSKVDFFKSGIILMAMQGEVPIVPVAILKREKWWHRQIVVVGEPIEITKDKLNLTQIDDLSASLRKKEEELINIYLNKRRNK